MEEAANGSPLLVTNKGKKRKRKSIPVKKSVRPVKQIRELAIEDDEKKNDNVHGSGGNTNSSITAYDGKKSNDYSSLLSSHIRDEQNTSVSPTLNVLDNEDRTVSTLCKKYNKPNDNASKSPNNNISSGQNYDNINTEINNGCRQYSYTPTSNPDPISTPPSYETNILRHEEQVRSNSIHGIPTDLVVERDGIIFIPPSIAANVAHLNGWNGELLYDKYLLVSSALMLRRNQGTAPSPSATISLHQCLPKNVNTDDEVKALKLPTKVIKRTGGWRKNIYGEGGRAKRDEKRAARKLHLDNRKKDAKAAALEKEASECAEYQARKMVVPSLTYPEYLEEGKGKTGRRKSGTGRNDSTRLIDKALELIQTQKYVAMGHAKAILPALEEAGFVFTPGPGMRDYWPDNHNGNFKSRRDALNKRMKRAGLLKGKKEQEQEKLRRQLEEVSFPFQVQMPAGVVEGQEVQVPHPQSGHMLVFAIPAGVKPGAIFNVSRESILAVTCPPDVQAGMKMSVKPPPPITYSGRTEWTKEEDEIVKNSVLSVDFPGWVELAKLLPERTDGNVRARWCDKLNSELVHGKFTKEEDLCLWNAYNEKGMKWSLISRENFNGKRSSKSIRDRFITKEFKKKYMTIV